MFYIFGDLHGNYDGELKYLNKNNFPEQKNLTKEDIVFQLGDFGYIWYYPEVKEKYKKDLNQIAELAAKNYTMLVIPGNHENYDVINSLPVVNKFNGKMRELKTKKGSIFIAIRGEVYEINNKKFFTFGGAKSNDIEDRYSKEEYERRKNSKDYKRRIGKSKINYWPEEVPSLCEYRNALKNLKKHSFKVDYVLTHTAPKSILSLLIKDENKLSDPTAEMLERIYKKTIFKNWFFGHIHENIKIGPFISHYKEKPLQIT